MPVLEGYENADTPHAKTVMAPGWTYGCHSSKTGDKPRGGPSTSVVRFGSVCSGIEAASVAFGPLGWKAAWFAEVEPFPSAVLAHHYPETPNLGDMTAISRRVLTGEVEAPDVLCGGTPCQAFSVAGLRESLADERGNLTLKFVELADAIDHVRVTRGDEPAIVFWENVPGVLSTKDNAFGCFLAGLAGEDDPLEPPGEKWANAGCVFGPKRAIAWRVLDAQYFQLAQRRRRVFVVASARDGFDPATVLFEWDGVRRDSAPSRKAGEDAAGCLASRTDGGGFPGTDEACGGYVQPVSAFCIKGAAIGRKPEAGPQYGEVLEDICYTQNCVEQHAVACTLRGDGFDAREDGTGRGNPIVVKGTTEQERSGKGWVGETPFAVRRLTVEECEFLQGFPRGYSKIPWRKKPASDCPDGPRYKALGNSWAVPCVAWIGRRIQTVIVASAERAKELG